jgi:hypothetical protein
VHGNRFAGSCARFLNSLHSRTPGLSAESP